MIQLSHNFVQLTYGWAVMTSTKTLARLKRISVFKRSGQQCPQIRVQSSFLSEWDRKMTLVMTEFSLLFNRISYITYVLVGLVIFKIVIRLAAHHDIYWYNLGDFGMAKVSFHPAVLLTMKIPCPGIILGMSAVNDRGRYFVTPSFNDWANTQNDPCCWMKSLFVDNGFQT